METFLVPTPKYGKTKDCKKSISPNIIEKVLMSDNGTDENERCPP